MRIRLLMAFATASAVAVPSFSQAGIGGVVHVTETVTLETEVSAPVPGMLVATLRTRRVASAQLDLASPGQPLAANFDERTSSVSFRTLKDNELVCFVSGARVLMDVDREDVVTLKVTDASCPMDLSFEAASSQVPFVRTPAFAGPDKETGAESGYSRMTTARLGTMLGEPAALLTGRLTRSTRAGAMPTTTTGMPNPQPPSAPDAPAPPEGPNAPDIPAPGDPDVPLP